MVRVRHIVAVAVAGTALAGCSGGSLMPDWMPFTQSAPPTATLQFESEPMGADVRTPQGATCRTPCSLPVPLESQSVTFTMTGFLPQTVAVERRDLNRSIFDSGPPADLIPNPVVASLQPLPPPVKPRPRRRRHIVRNRPPPRVAAPPLGGPAGPAAVPPPAQQPAASPFPPPPPIR
jgi:hypothetical protein